MTHLHGNLWANRCSQCDAPYKKQSRGSYSSADTMDYSETLIDRFIVSPYDRAQQTLAELQARAPTVPATVQDNITPSDDAHSALTDIAKIEAQCLVVVCHMSIVANLAALLTGDYPEAFSLAEARVFEMDFIMSGMATEVNRFVPEQPY